jgi:hypothetical protein
MRSFWHDHIWEALLCLVASVTLVLNFSQGFYIPDAVANSVPLAALVCAGALLYGYLGSYNRTTMVCFTIGFFVIAGGFFLWLRQNGVDIVDQEGSETAVYIYVIAAPIIALLTFLLSRSRLGTAALFVSGGCLHALIAFLGYAVKLWCAALFVPAVIALFLLRSYRVTALHSSTAAPNFQAYAGLASGVGLMGLALALAFWGLVLRPLDPPTLDVELLTRYMRYDVLEMVGIAQQYPVPDDWDTDGSQGDTLQAGETNDDQDDSPEEADGEADGPAVPEENQPDPNDTQDLASVSYDRDLTGLLAAVLVLVFLALLSVPFVRRWLRKRKLNRLRQGTTEEQVVALYRFYLEKFARLGCPRLPAQTEEEYAQRYARQLSGYTQGGMSLARMTALYLDARYGGLSPAPEDCQAMAELYPVLLKNCRERLGRGRYLLKYFVL